MAAPRVKHREVHCAWPAGASLGEAPLWIAEEAAVYWVDILRETLFRYAPSHRRAETCAMPVSITALAPMADGRLLCTAEREIHAFDTRSGRLSPIQILNADAQAIRINDGCCHADGAFWFGTMDLGERAPVGHFYRLSAQGICERVAAFFAITNGPAFTSDGSCGYFVDTIGRRILRAAMEDGRLVAPLRPFVQIPESDGFPDGLAVDTEGGVWCAHWGAGRVTRFDADGRASDVILMPVSNVTKCAFGGERLDRLFITTARKDLDATALASQPLAGGLFEADVGYRGVPAPRYRGSPHGEGASYACVFEPSQPIVFDKTRSL
jgi:xylono-1,5-lactonase